MILASVVVTVVRPSGRRRGVDFLSPFRPCSERWRLGLERMPIHRTLTVRKSGGPWKINGARLAGSCRCGTSVVRYVATAVAPSIETLEHAESIGSLGRKEAWRWLVGAQKYAGQPI